MRRMLTATLLLTLTVLSPVRAAPEADARAIVDKAIKAHGGADNLTKHKAGVGKMKGKVEVNGMTIEFVSTASVFMPDRMRVETEIDIMGNKITFTQVVSGAKGWYKLGDKVMDMDKDQVAEAREQLHAAAVATLAPLGDKAYKLSPLGEAKIDGKETSGVQVACKDRRDVNLYFDKKTGLLVKTETRSKEVLGGNDNEFTAEAFYSDYKEFNGVKRAAKHVLKRDGKAFGEVETTEYEGRDKLDDAVFAKP